MKVLITGTHLTPAQAVIEELRKNHGVKIVYVGRNSTLEGDRAPSIESKVLSELGIKFIPIIAGRLQKTFTPFTIPSLIKIPVGFVQAFYYLISEKPDVILSFGGYVSVPVVFCGWLLSIPIIIHEQTLVSGLANTISSYFANKIAISYEVNKILGSSKTILTGNPLRKELLTESKSILKEYKDFFENAHIEKLPVILVTGGNQGSHIINITIYDIISDLLDRACVIHQTGDSKFQDFDKLYELRKGLKNKQRYLVKKWIDSKDLGLIFRKIDLTISRAGANILYELAFFGVPTIVIPLPYLYNDEQNKNAAYYKDLGLVKILSQDQLTGANLFQRITFMLDNIKMYKEEAKKSKNIVNIESSKIIALETTLLASK